MAAAKLAEVNGAFADEEAMGQLLILHDDGETSAALSRDHSVMCAAELPDLQRILTTQSFDVAILVQPARPEQALAAIRSADLDLATILLDANPAAESKLPPGSIWEALTIPAPAAMLRGAVHRASQHTQSLRQIRALRSGVKVQSPNPAAPSVGVNGSAGHLQWISSLPPRFDLRELLSSIEKSVILRTLEATLGAQAEAARRLGLSRSDLSYKLAKYELRKPATVKATISSD